MGTIGLHWHVTLAAAARELLNRRSKDADPMGITNRIRSIFVPQARTNNDLCHVVEEECFWAVKDYSSSIRNGAFYEKRHGEEEENDDCRG